MSAISHQLSSGYRAINTIGQCLTSKVDRDFKKHADPTSFFPQFANFARLVFRIQPYDYFGIKIRTATDRPSAQNKPNPT